MADVPAVDGTVAHSARVKRAAETLDFGKPIALTMLGISGHVEDYDEARSIAGRLTGALAPGSHFVLNDGTNVHTPQQRDQAAEVTKDGGVAYIPRSPAEIEGFFDGTALLPRVWSRRRCGGR